MGDNSRNGSDVAPGNDELLRLIFESATDFAIICMDANGAVTAWNPGAERMLGYREEDIVGHSSNVIFTPEDREAGVPELERAQALADGRSEDERWTMRKDGSTFWASGLIMPLTNRANGFVKIFRDRTEGHRAEMRLRESEERFRLLATSIPQLVFRTRNDGWRVWGSPQWVNFTGLSLEQSLGMGWMDAIHPDDRQSTQAAWTEAQTSGAYYAEHRVRRAPDGQYRWHQTRARPIGELHGEWVGTMTDIHELRTLKDRQQVLVAELQHRTRNLLAVVQAIAAQVERSTETSEAFAARFHDRLRALGRVQLLLARTDENEVDLKDLVAAELAAHGQDGATGRARATGPSLALPAAAAQTIGLAVHELATNAVKYGALSTASGRLDVTWWEISSRGERRVLLEWVESGVHLPDFDRPRRRGYGSVLIEQALPYQLGAQTSVEFRIDGLRCTIAATLEDTSRGRENE